MRPKNNVYIFGAQRVFLGNLNISKKSFYKASVPYTNKKKRKKKALPSTGFLTILINLSYLKIACKN